MQPIGRVAEQLGLSAEDLRPYGSDLAKVRVASVRSRVDVGRKGKLILVTGMTPTPQGEGKTVTAIGTAMALRLAGKRAVACLRQPSLGPLFGVKGGATGGGKATVVPTAEINLGLTGDFDAVAAAHNLLAALIDNHLYQGNELSIDPATIRWPRTLDVNDRALRRFQLGRSNDSRQPVREGHFAITAASEVMAILGLSKDYDDLKSRLGRIIVAFRRDGRPVRASDLNAAGAMAALLRRALEPNLAQAADGTPAIIHCGPFGNIAHGTCSRLAIELGLASAEYCVVEAGFATELGAEKFVDLVSPLCGFEVSAGILVVTIRALRHHGGASAVERESPQPTAVEKGLENFEQHLSNLRTLGVPSVVAVNRFPSDSDGEVELVRGLCDRRGVRFAEFHGFAEGAEGARQVADHVVKLASSGAQARPIYGPDVTPEVAIERIVTQLYGGAGIELSPQAKESLSVLGRMDELHGPVCVAKTAFSLSDDPTRLGRPQGFTCPIQRIERCAGAGFTIAYLGEINTMPGLPKHPRAERIDLSAEGEPVGVE